MEKMEHFIKFMMSDGEGMPSLSQNRECFDLLEAACEAPLSVPTENINVSERTHTKDFPLFFKEMLEIYRI